MKAFSGLFTSPAGESALDRRGSSSRKGSQRCLPVVLAVDDNEDSLFLIQCAIEGSGIQCRLVLGGSGMEALKLAAVHQPSLILLDIRLPDINGIEILQLLRSSQHSRRVPVVAVSASIGPMDPFGISSAGFTHCLAKPYSVSDLEHIVSAYC